MVRFGLSWICISLGACGLGATNDWPGMPEAALGSTGGGSTDGTSGSGTVSGTSGHGSETGASAGASTGSEAGEPGTTGTTGTTTGPVAVCGDGLMEGEEECDDPGDTACFNCIQDRMVFVTSKFEFRGDFAKSSMNLDYWCNYLAAKAGVITDNKARFKPWISTSEGSAAERLHHSKGRYVLRNGLVFAQSWDALVAGEILNTLNVDENSQTRNVYVWTDTNPDGSAIPGEHCDDWNSASFELYAHYGKSSLLDGQWTMYAGPAANPTECGDYNAIYCFESP